MSIENDLHHAALSEVIEDPNYAAHGGLTVKLNKKTRMPTSFESSVTLYKIKYTFWIEFYQPVGEEIFSDHRSFYDQCYAAADKELFADSESEEK